MRALRLLCCGALCGTCLFPAIASGEEAGNPLILPAPTEKAPLKFTGKGGTTVFETSGNKIICNSYKYSGEMTSGRAGTGNIDFTECGSGETRCTSAGDSAGTVLDHGALHLVALEQSGKLTLGIEANLSETSNLSLKCGILSIEVKGAVIAETEIKPNEKVKVIEGSNRQKGGTQTIKECALPLETCLEESKFKKEKVRKKFLLEVNIGKGFTEMGMEAKGEVSFEKEIEIHF